jgi:hypothetical protein
MESEETLILSRKKLLESLEQPLVDFHNKIWEETKRLSDYRAIDAACLHIVDLGRDGIRRAIKRKTNEKHSSFSN